MTAQRVEYRPEDEPVPYTLTAKGEAATRTLLTTSEAAELLRVGPTHVARLARVGLITGVQVGGRWLLDGPSVRSYVPQRARPRGPGPSLPAESFLRVLDTRGGAAACGVRQHSAEEKAITRARRSGRLSEKMADRLSVGILGLTPWELWGDL